MGKSGQLLRLRVRVLDPPADVMFAAQEGSSGLRPPSESGAWGVLFEFGVTVADPASVPVRFTGAFAQGPAAARFVYICSGARAGQHGSCWERRAKVPLADIRRELVDAAMAEGKALECAIAGRARDGGPACASVPLLAGWTLV